MLCLKWCDCWASKDHFIAHGIHNETENDAAICFYTSILELPAPVLFFVAGIPHIFWLLKQPRVKPAPSFKFRFKITLTLIALSCSVALAVNSLSTRDLLYQLSLWFTSTGWLLALAIIWIGNWRALPQQWVLRGWWLITFISGLVLYVLHRQLQFPSVVHQMRGGYLLSVMLLAFLSWSPRDQEPYSFVKLGRSTNGSPHGVGSSFLSIFSKRSSSPKEPLLRKDSDISWGGQLGNETRGFFTHEHAKYGALESYGEGVKAWDQEIHEAAQRRLNKDDD